MSSFGKNKMLFISNPIKLSSLKVQNIIFFPLSIKGRCLQKKKKILVNNAFLVHP